MRRLLLVIAFVFAQLMMFQSRAQDASNTLFAYPVAPDSCSTLESRCNYIVTYFWKNFDISKPIADDAAFDKTFRDYINFFKYAHRNVVMASARDFIFKARANTANLSKIGRVAQGALYGPYAEYWSDELYIEIAKSISESTRLNANERKYYKHQAEVIAKCQAGMVLPDMEIVTADGKKKLSSIDGESFLLFFTDKSTDSAIQRTRLSVDVVMNSLIESGNIKVIQVSIDKVDADWYNNQPNNWLNGSCEHAMVDIDVRGVPCCFFLDKERKILVKNATVDDIKNALN